MKPRNSVRRSIAFPATILAGTLATLFSNQSAQAANRTWNGNTDVNLNTAANWDEGAWVSGSTAIFNVAGTSGSLLNNNLAAGTSVAGITFTGSASAYVIGDGTATANAGNSFSLTGNVTNNSSNLQTLNTPFTTSANWNFSTNLGNISLAGNISGANGFVKGGAGILTVSGTNSYNGTTSLGGGVLLFNSAGALPATSALTINGTNNYSSVIGLGFGDFTRSLAAGAGNATFSNNGGWAAYGANRVVNLGGGSTTIEWGTATTGFNSKILILGAPTATHTVDFQNPIDLGNAGRTIKVDNGAAVIDGKLSGNITGIAGGNLSKTSGGTLILSGANDYAGTTSAGGGRLLVNGTHTGTGAITIAASGLLGGTGTLAGAVTANVGAANNPSGGISLADEVIGTLTLGSTLTFSGTAAFPNNLNFDLGNGAGGTDKIVAAGKVTATTANAMVIHLNQLAGTPINPGTYPLIQGGATSTGTGYKLATTRAGGNLYTLAAFASDTLSVTVAAGDAGPADAFSYWQGDTAVWNTAQWYNDIDGTVTALTPGYDSNVRFATTTATNLVNTLGQDFEINSLTVDAGLAATSIGSSSHMLTLGASDANLNTEGNGITVNNVTGTTLSTKVGLAASQTWTVASDAALTVSGLVSDFGGNFSLTKEGAGILTLTGGTSFGGKLTITAGTVAIGGASTLGESSYYGNIVNNGTLSYGSSSNQNFYGVISGTGQLIKSGNSTLGIYGPNTYSGGTVINGGTLYVSNAFGGILPVGNVTINAGTLSGEQGNLAGSLVMNGGKWFENNGFGGSWTGPVNLTATSTMETPYFQTVNGSITGVGGLIKAGTGTLAFNSTGNDYAGTTLVSAGILSLAKPVYLYNADTSKWTPENITVNSGGRLVLFVGGATDFTGPQLSTLFTNLGTVNNNGLKAGAAVGFDTTNAGANVVDITGDIVDSVGTGGGKLSINKYGAGTLLLSGDNTYSGPTFIQVGYLSIDSFNSVTTDEGLGTVHSASSSLGAPTTVADGTLHMSTGGNAFNNGFIYNGTGETTDRKINLLGGSPANLFLTQSGTGLLKFTTAFTAVGSNSNNFGINLQGSTAGTGEIPFVIPQLNGALTTITKSGTGTWTLSNANTYGGVTNVNGGALVLTNATSIPGGISDTGGTSAITFNGGVLGLGEGDFTRSLAAANTVTGVNFTGNGGWAAYGANRSVNLGGSLATITWVTANTGFNNKTVILGNVTATHTVTLQNPLNLTNGARTVQADDGLAVVDGELSGNITGVAGGNLLKTGLGTLALSGTNDYAGTTSVNAGTLLINGSNTGSGTVNVAAVGRLGGNGSTAAAVTVVSGGKLLFDISNWTGAAGTGFTDLDVASLALTGITWTVDISSATAFANFSETTKTFPFLTASGSITGFDADNVTITPGPGFTGTGTWSIQKNVNTLELVYTSSAGTPYDIWALAKGLDGTAGKENGAGDDPDKDGRNNLAEFAFNGDPLSGSDNGRIFVLSEDSDFDDPDAQKELILTVAVRADTPAFTGSPSPSASKDGITYTIEGSLTLGGFATTVNVVPTPVTIDGITPLPAAGTGYEYRSFSLSGSNGLPGAGFLRAKVTQP